MEIIPAIDIKEGQCVRLNQGDFNQEKVYSQDPSAMAQFWAEKGAPRLHIVDLDGAKAGKPCNLSLIENIVETLEIPVQLGGGIRSLAVMKQYLEIGVDRVIVGTLALKNPELVEKAVSRWGSARIAAGVDARKGLVSVEGWLETSEKKVSEVIKDLKKRGVKTFIYTDISRDGMLTGPDIEGLKNLLKLGEIEIIASGGISSREDLNKLKEAGISSAIIGKALYEDKLDIDSLWK